MLRIHEHVELNLTRQSGGRKEASYNISLIVEAASLKRRLGEEAVRIPYEAQSKGQQWWGTRQI